MAKIVVVYTSQTGFTQQYALWIAKSLHCEVLDTKFITTEDLAKNNLVIYGGHVIGQRITGFRQFYHQYQAALPIPLFVFGTGIAQLDGDSQQRLRKQNFGECTTPPQFFYFHGHVARVKPPLRMRVGMKVRGVKPERAQCVIGTQAVRPLLEAVVRQEPTSGW
ncbi:flavodoxin domain-containing protein [Lacticaseibacillus baoqingensis]|uniref:Flavodoxin domain-containing protein n=1 Tax=Lacticaseibacillus baoqingensis TaxID=2486013 RepID=A0ABW4E451_9LACO|nr:flavodoxin domain-containing protein [Lacticaseibacillus baoqingensis]